MSILNNIDQSFEVTETIRQLNVTPLTTFDSALLLMYVIS